MMPQSSEGAAHLHDLYAIGRSMGQVMKRDITDLHFDKSLGQFLLSLGAVRQSVGLYDGTNANINILGEIGKSMAWTRGGQSESS